MILPFLFPLPQYSLLDNDNLHISMNNKIININTPRKKASEHQVECLKCGKLIPKASRRCIYCGVNYSKEISEIVYETSPRKKRTALIIIALLLIIILLFFL